MNIFLSHPSLAPTQALLATSLFALASIWFSDFAKRITPIWMNSLKTLLSFLFFLSLLLIFEPTFFKTINWKSATYFFLSGFFSLYIGDIFLLQSYRALGPARTFMVFSCQPLILAPAAYFLFDQTFTLSTTLGILFFILSVVIIGKDEIKKNKTLGLKLFIPTILALLLDSTGSILTKLGSVQAPLESSLSACFVRSLGAVFGFLLIRTWIDIKLIHGFRSLSSHRKTTSILVSIFGTAIPIWIMLTALTQGHIASVSAIAQCGPLFATFFESVADRKLPSKAFQISLLFFLAGFILINFDG